MLRFALALLLAGCAARTVPPAPIVEPAPAVVAPAVAPLELPPALVGYAVVLGPNDPDYARADLAAAVKPPGDGGLAEGLVVRLTAEVPVYRMWSGPEAVDARGNTNRLGQWWAWEAPSGTVADYRARYEVCTAWNELDWVASCTLRAGAVVAVGPGQSVSAALCGDAQESYAANLVDWQIYIAGAWTRTGPDGDLACPEQTADYAADPADLGSRQGSTSR